MGSRKTTARKAHTPRPSSSGQLTLEAARKLTVKRPGALQGWKHFGARLIDVQRYEEAFEALEKALSIAPDDHETLALLGRSSHRLGMVDKAQAYLRQALEIKSDYASANHYLAYILYQGDQNTEAYRYAEAACEQCPDDPYFLITKCNIETRLYRYAEAIETIETALRIQKDSYHSWNSLGNLKKEIGQLDEAVDAYRKAMEIAPGSTGPFSNLITTLHYHPGYSNEAIVAQSKAWDEHFSHISNTHRPRPSNPDPGKRLRIGMISDGFRGHPVGRMTTRALESLSSPDHELYFYSTNHAEDSITHRLKAIATRWMSVQHMNDEQFATQVVSDEVDILIDMAGHNAGNRMLGVAMAPAPLIVKWVGGQINTTGISAIDYLIGDPVETPEGVDDAYVEKLIRLPDDYICYDPPAYAPAVDELPALKNGVITFGCFNNAAKINEVLLEQWAHILKAVPGSRLLLKSMQYKSDDLCERLNRILAENDISNDRVTMEGPSPHRELLAAYNRVDIALDPWPYSGGVTTCEAMLMGVPVITLPGPTFAGRHSATHLSNAGLTELVARDWDHYVSLAASMAEDLDTLATIRQGLRQQLLASPACDAQRFAAHLNGMLRAIWQRYCEGKPPAALTFDQSGQAWFKGESEAAWTGSPAVAASGKTGANFNWMLSSPVVVVDNGCKLFADNGFDRLRQLGTFAVIGFDPRNQVEDPAQYEQDDNVQCFPHAVLGDGETATLYACLDPAMSATLKPLPAHELPESRHRSARVLTELPIKTLALDSIEGLDDLDWLILDDRADALQILQHGEKALLETLLIQIRIAFQPTHYHQSDMSSITSWAKAHGFRFYRLNDCRHISHWPDNPAHESGDASELEAADMLLIPSRQRLDDMPEAQKMKLAFLLHSVFGIRDLSFRLLAGIDTELADSYRHQCTPGPAPAPGQPRQPAVSAGAQPSPPRDDSISHQIDRLLGH